jgi:hypothetical protein
MITCPICGTGLELVGHAEGFCCPQHGNFKVGGSVLATKEGATSEQWEKALAKARARAKIGDWPTITIFDF